MSTPLDAFRFGVFHGHKRGEYFVDGNEVWKCKASDSRGNYEESELQARFLFAKDARRWLRVLKEES